MKTKSTVGLLALGLVSLMAIGSPTTADANARNRQKILDKKAARAGDSNWAELHKDRQELRRDVNELERDRADLNRLYRSGASRREIAKKRAEIDRDLAEIHQDRREIRDDYGALRRDGRDRDVYADNDRWNNNNGWWGRGNSDSWNRGNDNWNRGRWGR